MFEMMHRQTATGWVFHCPTVQSVNGGAHNYDESVANAEHCFRQHLSRRAGYDVKLTDAACQLHHTSSMRPSDR